LRILRALGPECQFGAREDQGSDEQERGSNGEAMVFHGAGGSLPKSSGSTSF
jgi:hypothetical protein